MTPTPEEQEILNRAEEIGKRLLKSLGKDDPKSIATLCYLAGLDDGMAQAREIFK